MDKLAIIAGTPVDTQMGVNYIKTRGGYEAIYLPAFDCPRDCHIFQMADDDYKKEKMQQLFNKAIDQGCSKFFIYCNSLSSAFDYNKLAEEMGVCCVTPLNAYEKIANKYDKLAVIAANNQATCGIEKVFTNVNPSCYVIGLGILSLVEAIESKMAPAEIVSKFKLPQLIDFFNNAGCQALVLGCTHFPYFKNQLSGIKIIDPADIMYDLI